MSAAPVDLTSCLVSGATIERSAAESSRAAGRQADYLSNTSTATGIVT